MSFADLSTPVNSTTITMNERFSGLPQQVTLAGPSRDRSGSISLKPASAKNRQFAEMLEHRSNELLLKNALNAKKAGSRNLQRRLGLGARGARSLRPVVDRLGITARLGNLNAAQTVGRGRGRRRGRGGPIALQRSALRRSGSALSLLSASNLQSPNNAGRQSRSRLRMDQPQVRSGSIVRARSRSRSRSNFNPQLVRRGRSRSRGGIVPAAVLQQAGLRSRSRGRNQPPRGTGLVTRGRGRGQNPRRSRSISRQPNRGGIQGGRGRSRGRGRGRAARGRGGRVPPPSKDVLDKQLDQYMASSQDDPMKPI